MVEYKIIINNGNEAFGTTGKTLSVEEKPRTVSVDFLADAIHSQNELVSKRLAAEVLSTFGAISARLMAEGLAIQFQQDGKAILRLYADTKIKDGNINLERARQLTGEPELTEAQMVERAGEIVRLAGVKVRAYAEVEQKFTEAIASFNPQVSLVGIEEKAYVERTNSNAGGSGSGDNQGGDNGGGDDLNPGENDG